MNTYLNNWFLVALTGFGLFTSRCNTNQEQEIDCSVSGPAVVVNEADIVPANCAPNGSFTSTATGGTGELMFSIDGINFQSSPIFTGLSAGQYAVSVSDQNSCIAAANVTIENSGNDLSLTVSASATGGCGTGEGSITVSGINGSGGYTYRLNNGEFVSDNVFTNISGGTYNITVKDSEGCTNAVQAKVNSGVSWSTQIKPIFDTNCNITTCHGEDLKIPNLTVFSTVKTNALSIKSLTQNKTMPQDGSLTQNQIDLIACWVDDGAPAN